MSAALTTATLVGIATLVVGFALGITSSSGPELLQHTTVSIFGTLVVLFSHSMLMFYLIGKGRAVRDAVSEGGLSSEPVTRLAALRRPVFSQATVALALTITTAVLGGGVDTGVVPPLVHGLLGFASIASNLLTLRVELTALTGASRIVSEIDGLMAAKS